jgi:hypothetical protein
VPINGHVLFNMMGSAIILLLWAVHCQGQQAEVKVSAGQWHSQRVVQQGNRTRCFRDAKLYLEVNDGTFTQAGKIELWTKADAQTYFADLTVASK